MILISDVDMIANGAHRDLTWLWDCWRLSRQIVAQIHPSTPRIPKVAEESGITYKRPRRNIDLKANTFDSRQYQINEVTSFENKATAQWWGNARGNMPNEILQLELALDWIDLCDLKTFAKSERRGIETSRKDEDRGDWPRERKHSGYCMSQLVVV